MVYEICMNRRSKSKIVHVDKLAPVRGEVDGDWVFKLPKKLKEYEAEHSLEGISQLFDETAQNPVPSTREQTTPAVNSTSEASTNTQMLWPAPQVFEIPENVAGTIEPALEAEKPAEIERDPSKKITRSGKSYLAVSLEDEFSESDSEFCAHLFE